jgi:hypothetical protein
MVHLRMVHLRMIHRRFSGLRLMAGVRVGRRRRRRGRLVPGVGVGRRRRWRRWRRGLLVPAVLLVPGMLRGSRRGGEQAGKARRQKKSGLHC